MYTRRTTVSISLSWSLPAGSTGSQVSWRLTGRGRRSAHNAEGGTSGLITGDSYTVTDLSNGTSYDITLTILHPDGNTSTTFTTSTDGYLSNTFMYSHSIPLSNRHKRGYIIIVVINCNIDFWCTGSGGCGSCSHNHNTSHCCSHSTEEGLQSRRYTENYCKNIFMALHNLFQSHKF